MPKKKSLDLGLGNPISFYNGEIILRFSERDHVYYRIDDGVPVPVEGVTSVCSIIDKSLYLIPWACKMMAEKLLRTMPSIVPSNEMPQETLSILWTDFELLVADAKKAHRERLTDAGDVGTAAHNWIEDSIRWAITFNKGVVENLTEQAPEDERARNCGHAALDWMKENHVVWKNTEHKIYSREFGYAGTMDGLAEVRGILSVVDWKTSNNLRTEYLLQTAAYLQAHKEEFGVEIPDRWILRLGKDEADFEPWHLGPDTLADDFESFRLCLTLRRLYSKVEKRMADTKKMKTLKEKAGF